MNEQQIFDALKGQRCPHAVLIAGAAGTGKRALARRMAAVYISGEPDGTALNNNPNFLELGERGFSADDVRALTASANMAGFNGGRRAFLLFDAHRMQPQAQNALLKTLEEPPTGVLFLLTGTELGFLATIRSRCAVLRLGARKEEEISSELMADGIDEETARLAASLSGGVTGLAHLYATQAFRTFRDEAICCLESALFSVPPFAEAAKLAASTLFKREGAEAKKSDVEAAEGVLNIFQSVLADALFQRIGCAKRVNTDRAALIMQIANRFTSSEIQGMITETGDAGRKLTFRANPVFTLDAALVRLSQYKEKHA